MEDVIPTPENLFLILNISDSFGLFFTLRSKHAYLVLLLTLMSELVKNFILLMRISGSKNSLFLKKLSPLDKDFLLVTVDWTVPVNDSLHSCFYYMIMVPDADFTLTSTTDSLLDYSPLPSK